MADFILHNYFRSSTSYRVRIGLALKGIDYEYRPVHLLKGEQNSLEYRKLNPAGGVPTLVHKGNVIADSNAILQYLEQILPSPALMPEDAYERARIRQYCEIISGIHPLGNLKVQSFLASEHHFDQAKKEEWVQHWYHDGLTALENIAQASSGTYTFGNTLTMADLYLVPQLLTAKRFKVDLTSYPTLQKIESACLTQEAFKKAHPFNQPDTPEEFRPKITATTVAEVLPTLNRRTAYAESMTYLPPPHRTPKRYDVPSACARIRQADRNEDRLIAEGGYPLGPLQTEFHSEERESGGASKGRKRARTVRAFGGVQEDALPPQSAPIRATS